MYVQIVMPTSNAGRAKNINPPTARKPTTNPPPPSAPCNAVHNIARPTNIIPPTRKITLLPRFTNIGNTTGKPIATTNIISKGISTESKGSDPSIPIAVDQGHSGSITQSIGQTSTNQM
jgi:hypothetical protein